MTSITTRTAIVASATFVVIAVALSLVGPLLLRSSLIDQVDDGLISWNSDMAIQASSFDDLALSDGEPGTYWAIVDSELETLTSPNLSGIDVEALATVIGAPHTVELPTTEQTSLRLLASDSGSGLVLTGRDLAPIDDTTGRVRLWGLGVSLLLGGVVFFLTRRATARALEPMNRIAQAVNDLGADNLSARVPVPETDDEVAALAATMNRMLGRVEVSVDRQSRFAADASHELRSPLASLKTQLDVASAHPDTIDLDRLLPQLSSDVDRASLLVSDLLALARSGNSATTPALLDLDDIVLGHVARLHATESDVRVDTSQVVPTLVRADPQHVARLVENLLTNATRHASSQVTIGVRATGTGPDQGATLTIDDDGAGIAPADRARIFDPFTRLDEARSRDAGGSGLGLALVAELAAANGATVSVGDAPSGGARFSVVFPGPPPGPPQV